ncbi:MAG: hypothetical protein FWD17_18145 [Polyangiaceae bacterium]|nr:hypothetical protein [Polyangiaceae bacterium]
MNVRNVAYKLKSPVGLAVVTGFEIAGTAAAFGVAQTLMGVAAAYWAYRALGGRPPEPLGVEAGAEPAGLEVVEVRDDVRDELRQIEARAAAALPPAPVDPTHPTRKPE